MSPECIPEIPKELVCGIDPGQSGGLILLTPRGQLWDYLPMPMVPSHGKTYRVDVASLWSFFDTPYPPIRVWVELVHPIQGSSAKSAFTFGRYVQAIHDVLDLLQDQQGIQKIPSFSLVDPKTWQKEVLTGQYKGKDTTMAWARRAYPGLHEDFYSHDGLCDALAIATYGLRKSLPSPLES